MGERKVKLKQKPISILTEKKCICGALFGFSTIILAVISMITDPASLLTTYYVKIENGSYVYNKLHERINAVNIKMYIFNITNSGRFMSGLDKNLKLQEVGPFTYKEMRVNRDIEIDSEQKVLRYSPDYSLIFIPEESVADPKSTYVYVPNIIMLGLASRVAREPFMVKAVFEMLSRVHSLKPILKMTAEDMLMGYHDPFVDIGNRFIPGIIFFDKIGLLHFPYDPKRSVRYEVHTEEDKKFQIKTVTNEGGPSRLGFIEKRTECNTLKNTYEGIMFPTNLSPSSKIKIFNKVFCRLLELEFVRNRTSDDGGEALEFRFSEEALIARTACNCFQKKCIRGIWDMSPCAESIPIALSYAHFLHAEKAVFNRLEGLQPDKEKHDNQFVIHKAVGLPLKTHFTLQINVLMDNVDFSSATKPFSDMVVPVAWSRVDQCSLPNDIASLLKFVTTHLPRILLVFRIVTFFVATSIICYTCQFIYNKSHVKREEKK